MNFLISLAVKHFLDRPKILLRKVILTTRKVILRHLRHPECRIIKASHACLLFFNHEMYSGQIFNGFDSKLAALKTSKRTTNLHNLNYLKIILCLCFTHIHLYLRLK